MNAALLKEGASKWSAVKSLVADQVGREFFDEGFVEGLVDEGDVVP